MPDFKRHIGALNSMGRKHAKLNTRALIEARKAENIARLVERMKAATNG